MPVSKSVFVVNIHFVRYPTNLAGTSTYCLRVANLFTRCQIVFLSSSRYTSPLTEPWNHATGRHFLSMIPVQAIHFSPGSSKSQTREVLGFENLSDNNFSFPSHPLHNYSFPSVLKLPQRPSPSPHTYVS